MWKVRCSFTEAETETRAWRDLGQCHYHASIESYEEFLGPESCHVTGLGKAVARITGHHGFGLVDVGINLLYFSTTSIAGGVCSDKAGALFDNGFHEPGVTQEELQETMCEQLEADLQRGRLDDFSMATWAAATGDLSVIEGYPQPSDDHRLLHKFRIPGWPDRTVASETPPEDPAQIDLANGAVQCMMRRLRMCALDDGFHDDKNEWGGPSVLDRWGLALDPNGPSDPLDLLYKYYGRFLIYHSNLPRGFHFDVPPAEITSDRALESLVFRSVGAHRLEALTDGGTIDFNPVSLGGALDSLLAAAVAALPAEARSRARYVVRMEGLYDDLQVRDGMARWGGNAYFDGRGRILAIQRAGEVAVPGGGRSWEYFKFVFRSSLLATVTAVDHLVVTHILAAETLAVSMWETLDADSGLRLLLAPHTYGTLAINANAAMNLFPRNMLVHRASPWAEEAFEPQDGSTGLIWAKSRLLRYRKFEERYAAYRDVVDRTRVAYWSPGQDGEDAPEIPFFEDGMAYFRIIRQHVNDVVSTIYSWGHFRCNIRLRRDVGAQRFVNRFFALGDPGSPDFWPTEFREAHSSCNALISLLAETIFLVSGWHRHVGTVADFYRDLRFASTAWKEGELQPRPKHGILTLLLAATTNAILPKMATAANQTHIFASQPKLQRVFEDFAHRLEGLQTEIEVRNRRRIEEGNLAFHQMEPKEVEWGVMV